MKKRSKREKKYESIWTNTVYSDSVVLLIDKHPFVEFIADSMKKRYGEKI